MDEEFRELIALKLIEILESNPLLTAKQLVAEISRPDVDRSLINSVMYLDKKKRFQKDDSPRPQFFLTANGVKQNVAVKPAGGQSGAKTKELVDVPIYRYEVGGLREWQEEALAAWEQAGCTGIVEAVTGAGKTRLAMAAIARELNLGGKVAVIVPSRELQRQWEREIHQYFDSADIGLMGNGHSDSLVENDILIAVVNAASQKELGLIDGESGLLVADECHRLGAEKFQLALEDVFPNRLGLSATRERTDGAHDTVLAPYFGDVVYSLGYKAAMAGGYISQVKVAQIEVQLSDDEQLEFDELSEAISASQFELSKRFGIPLEPYSRFMEEVHNLAMNGDMKQGMAAKRYISSVTKRRKLLANTPKKSEVLTTLVSAINNSNRTIIFTETISGVTNIYNLLNESGIATEQLHAQLLTRERVGALHMFATGQCKALVAARVLDEGIDVPEADLAIIVSATKTRRQMIQRMGRVLRPKKDGRPARFVLVYVAGTSEDPANGAHDAFFNEVIDISKESKIFEQPLDMNDLTEFLNP